MAKIVLDTNIIAFSLRFVLDHMFHPLESEVDSDKGYSFTVRSNKTLKTKPRSFCLAVVGQKWYNRKGGLGYLPSLNKGFKRRLWF